MLFARGEICTPPMERHFLGEPAASTHRQSTYLPWCKTCPPSEQHGHTAAPLPAALTPVLGGPEALHPAHGVGRCMQS